MTEPLRDHKELCQAMAPAGWVYTGFSDGNYFFQTGDYRAGFREMKCEQQDLTAQNLALMARLGVTRS